VRKVDDATSIAAEIDSEDRLVFAAVAYRGDGVSPTLLSPGQDPPPPDYEVLVTY